MEHDEQEQRGLAKEMYQSSQEVIHVEATQQTPQTPLPKKRNRFIGIFIAIVLFGISVGISGGYYLTTHTEINLPLWLGQVTPSPTPYINRTAAIILQELQGFPAYPGAIYIKKETVPPCTGEVSGYSVCDAITYTWQTDDSVQKVQLSYRDIISKSSGWKFSGGAGSVEDGGVQSFSKGEFGLAVHINGNREVEGGKTVITVAVPRVLERMQKENWKTYKTEIGVSLKIPQDIKVEEGFQYVSFYLDEVTKKGSGITIYTRNIAINEGIDVGGRELKETFISGYKATYIADNPDTLKDYWLYSTDNKQVIRITISTVGESDTKQKEAMQLYTDMLSSIRFDE